MEVKQSHVAKIRYHYLLLPDTVVIVQEKQHNKQPEKSVLPPSLTLQSTTELQPNISANQSDKNWWCFPVKFSVYVTLQGAECESVKEIE